MPTGNCVSGQWRSQYLAGTWLPAPPLTYLWSPWGCLELYRESSLVEMDKTPSVAEFLDL